jgi:hypothetical protein
MEAVRCKRLRTAPQSLLFRPWSSRPTKTGRPRATESTSYSAKTRRAAKAALLSSTNRGLSSAGTRATGCCEWLHADFRKRAETVLLRRLRIHANGRRNDSAAVAPGLRGHSGTRGPGERAGVEPRPRLLYRFTRARGSAASRSPAKRLANAASASRRFRQRPDRAPLPIDRFTHRLRRPDGALYSCRGRFGYARRDVAAAGAAARDRHTQPPVDCSTRAGLPGCV